MSLLVDHQAVNLPTGPMDLGPYAIPDGANEISIRLSRDTTATPTFWPNQGTLLSYECWIDSNDGRGFMFQAGSYSIAGGIAMFHGLEKAEQDLRLRGLMPTTGRQLKGHVEVTSGPLVSQLTIEAI